MANITAALKAASGNSQRGRNVYYVDNVIDLTANSINPNGDTIQAITVPANTLVLAAGLQVVNSATMNTGTDATASLGFTGGDVDEFVATFDIDGAADGAYAPQIAITGLTALTTGVEGADIDAFKALCKKLNLLLIEDAACAIGSKYKGKRICYVMFRQKPRNMATIIMLRKIDEAVSAQELKTTTLCS